MLPTDIRELVVATVASGAENLEHVLAKASIVLGRPGGGDSLQLVPGQGGGDGLGAEAAAFIDPTLGVESGLGESGVSGLWNRGSFHLVSRQNYT